MNTFENDVTISASVPWRNINDQTSKSDCEDILREGLKSVQAKASFNDLAMLDAKMMYVIASKQGLNEVANDFRDVILDGLKFMQRPPIAQLTYEDIILTNPKSDMRTFTDGTVGDSEAAFYRGNQALEGNLNSVIDALCLAGRTGEISFLDTACQSVMEASKTMETIRNEIDSSNYQLFRTYFDANPFTGEKGPSGLFSATIPHIEILLKGWDNYAARAHLVENVAYFPQRDVLSLRQSLNEGSNLSDRFADNATAKGQLNAIGEWVDKFRCSHKKSMRQDVTMRSL